MTEAVSLIYDLENFSFELLLCGDTAVPKVVANGALLEEELEGLLVFTDANETTDIGDCTTKESSLEEALWDRRVLFL